MLLNCISQVGDAFMPSLFSILLIFTESSFSHKKKLKPLPIEAIVRGYSYRVVPNWWINRKDPAGKNVFAGGFLGLDNIGIFDRSAQLPTGGSLEQADGTAWMAFYCQQMFNALMNEGKGDNDHSGLVQYLEKAASVTVKKPQG